MSITLNQLKQIVDLVIDKEGGNIEVVTLGHYGEPHEYYKDEFYLTTTDKDYNDRLLKKPTRVFNIEYKNIGPEPD
jgi:hypothetical protein